MAQLAALAADRHSQYPNIRTAPVVTLDRRLMAQSIAHIHGGVAIGFLRSFTEASGCNQFDQFSGRIGAI